MTPADYAFTALTLWREARGQQISGMTAVACVIRNIAAKHGQTPFQVVTKKWAFSSMTAPGDSQLVLYPVPTDPQWQQCQLIAQNVLDGDTADITGGATMYWAPGSIKSGATFETPNGPVAFPQSWDASKVRYSCTIGSQVFVTEVA